LKQKLFWPPSQNTQWHKNDYKLLHQTRDALKNAGKDSENDKLKTSVWKVDMAPISTHVS
jgi:hypothetical protein